ncbi:MAG: insulinase family protein [Chloroflexi bacterium]|nr:insulinase family protein [Chloroflexota bacterium]
MSSNLADLYQKVILDNGLRIITIPMPHTRSVSLAFFLAIGSRYEEATLGGISHFIEHMLFKGTEKRPTAKEVSEAIEGIGGVFNASTGREMTMYWAKVPQGHLELGLDVLGDMLLHSKFEEGELEKERRVIIEEINQTLDTPDDWVGLLITQLQWPDHPLGRDIAGTRETISAVSRENMLGYLGRHYHPRNLVVSVAGNMEQSRVQEQLAQAFGGWGTKEKVGFLPAQPNRSGPRTKVGHKETEQAHLALSLESLPRLHPDRFVLRLLNALLGEGMSSRLFLEVREKRGLAYSVHSYIEQLADSGALGIYAGVDPERLEPALQAVLGELDRLRQEGVPGAEFEKTREFVKGRLMLQMEDSLSVASWHGRQEILDDQILSVDEVLARLDAVTAQDVQKLAQNLFQTPALNLAVVGPFPAQKEERLRGLLQLP